MHIIANLSKQMEMIPMYHMMDKLSEWNQFPATVCLDMLLWADVTRVSHSEN